jgi:hypothetical protein
VSAAPFNGPNSAKRFAAEVIFRPPYLIVSGGSRGITPEKPHPADIIYLLRYLQDAGRAGFILPG